MDLMLPDKCFQPARGISGIRVQVKQGSAVLPGELYRQPRAARERFADGENDRAI